VHKLKQAAKRVDKKGFMDSDEEMEEQLKAQERADYLRQMIEKA
jgi:hypothetical protein